jgi:hypothetical protein
VKIACQLFNYLILSVSFSTALALSFKIEQGSDDLSRKHGWIQAGLQRAKAEGKTLGRPSKTTPAQRVEIRHRLGVGESVSALARDYAISRANIIGIREANT